jgi:hypothetical protein
MFREFELAAEEVQQEPMPVEMERLPEDSRVVRRLLRILIIV